MRYITEDQAARVLEHLKVVGAVDCPVCGERRWNITGPAALILFDSSNPVMGPWLNTFPLVVLTCAKCSFVRQFAWVPLLGALRGSSGMGKPNEGDIG